MFCIRASSAFIIVEMASEACKTQNATVQYAISSRVFGSRVFASERCKLLINLSCIHITFSTQFQPEIPAVSDQEEAGKLEIQLKRFQE